MHEATATEAWACVVDLALVAAAIQALQLDDAARAAHERAPAIIHRHPGNRLVST